MKSIKLLRSAEDHAAELGLSEAQFQAELPRLLAHAYPARRIGSAVVAEKHSAITWVAARDQRRAANDAPITPGPIPLRLESVLAERRAAGGARHV